MRVRTEDLARELRDLRGRAVAHLQRLERRRRHTELFEQLLPVELAAVVALFEHALRGVAGESDTTFFGREIEQHAELDRARVLDLVDEHVGVANRAAVGPGKRPAEHLPEAQQDGRVLGVDGRGLAVALAFAAHTGLAHAPLVHAIELPRTEARLALEDPRQALARGQQLVPRRGNAARLIAQILAELLDRVPRHVGKRRTGAEVR